MCGHVHVVENVQRIMLQDHLCWREITFRGGKLNNSFKSPSYDTDQTFLQKNQVAGNDDHSSQAKNMAGENFLK